MTFVMKTNKAESVLNELSKHEREKSSSKRKTYQFTISGYPMCLALVRRHWQCKAISLYHQRSNSSQQNGLVAYRLQVFDARRCLISFSYALVWVGLKGKPGE